ncbi:MAG: DnaJ domain-containing protein [Nitrospirota bacterium]
MEEDFWKRIDEIYFNLDKLSEYELLDVDEGSDVETIKKNYYRLAKEFHPDRYFSSDPTIKDKLTSIFDALTRAYTAMTEGKKGIKDYIPPGKVRKEEISNATKAEELFKRGIEEFKEGNFWGAVDSLKWAAKFDPKKAKYWSYLSLSFTKIPNRLKDAEQALLEAIKLDPYNAEYYVNLGMIYVKAGMKKRAQHQFEKALKFDPRNVDAKRGLRQTLK